jgi:hypothetical protein
MNAMQAAMLKADVITKEEVERVQKKEAAEYAEQERSRRARQRENDRTISNQKVVNRFRHETFIAVRKAIGDKIQAEEGDPKDPIAAEYRLDHVKAMAHFETEKLVEEKFQKRAAS